MFDNHDIKPITLKFSLFKVYTVASLIEHISMHELPFFADQSMENQFKESCKNIYGPIFEFLLVHNIEASLILTGEFVDELCKHDKKVFKLLEKLIKKNKVNIVLDAYYGDSLTCMYNTSWWVEGIEESYKKILDLLGVAAKTVYLPQLFRNLELERVVDCLGIKRFLLQNSRKKGDFISTRLSDLRRFNGKTVGWINDDNDCEVEFFYVPNEFFMIPNKLILEKDLIPAVPAYSMNMGLQYHSQFLKKRGVANIIEVADTIRIPEKFSLHLYSHLQRSVIRLWDYGAFIISSEYNRSEKNKELGAMKKNFAMLQDPFFLEYLQPKVYNMSHLEIKNFSSPYEAFANMQGSVKKIEIELRNSI